MTDNERDLRRLMGFAYFWWWRGFTGLGCVLRVPGVYSGARFRLAMALMRVAKL
jgi:hypothetical protein